MTEREKKRLQNLQEKMSQMKAQEQQIISREKSRQRKERTRRLIKIGTLTEELLNCGDMELANVEKLLNQLVALAGFNEYVEDIKKSLL